ncbi:MAG: AEC family transporter [Bosea sp. (in: a-proteobacteria)]|jgi:malonate transporter
MASILSLFDLVLPFFGMIALGYFCGKRVKLSAEGLAWMQFFLIYVSLPMLFFRLIADKPLSDLTNWPYVIATTLATYVVFALSFTVGLYFTRGNLPQSVMQGVAGAYSNIGYMGPPLVLAALGPAASAPVVLIFVFDNLLLFSLIPFLMALAGVEKKSMLQTARDVAWKVVTHPFNVATVLGVIAAVTKLQLPSALDKMTIWLSGAAAPCALFLLGVTVAIRPMQKMPPEVPALMFIKLIVHPLLILLLLSIMGDFPPAWVFAGMVMAALPPALNIFVISTQYGVGVERASASILVGTIASMVTLTLFLWLIREGYMPHDLFPSR